MMNSISWTSFLRGQEIEREVCLVVSHQPQPSHDLQFNSTRSLISQLAAVTKV